METENHNPVNFENVLNLESEMSEAHIRSNINKLHTEYDLLKDISECLTKNKIDIEYNLTKLRFEEEAIYDVLQCLTQTEKELNKYVFMLKEKIKKV